MPVHDHLLSLAEPPARGAAIVAAGPSHIVTAAARCAASTVSRERLASQTGTERSSIVNMTHPSSGDRDGQTAPPAGSTPSGHSAAATDGRGIPDADRRDGVGATHDGWSLARSHPARSAAGIAAHCCAADASADPDRAALIQRDAKGRFTSDHTRDVAAMEHCSWYDPRGYTGRWPYCSHEYAAERRRHKAALGLDWAEYSYVIYGNGPLAECAA